MVVAHAHLTSAVLAHHMVVPARMPCVVANYVATVIYRWKLLGEKWILAHLLFPVLPDLLVFFW